MVELESKIRLLVVGGSGFIGSHIVKHAIELGWEVTSLGLNKRMDGSSTTEYIKYIAADITNKIALKEALGDARYEYVVNCGGYINHKPFSQGGRKIIDTHFNGVLNLIELLNRDVLQAFVNIGSSDEYGDAPVPQNENMRESPISPYSLGKAAATNFLQMLNRTENFPSATLRLFLTYGPGQDQNRFLPQIISGCLHDKSFPVSKGEQLRDFCFIDDTVEAVFLAFDKREAYGEVINIASGAPVAIKHVIGMVNNIVGKGVPEYGAIPYRPSENMELYADISKAEMLLNWKPKIKLEDGLRQTINWAQDQL